jgi:hypothetical protein
MDAERNSAGSWNYLYWQRQEWQQVEEDSNIEVQQSFSRQRQRRKRKVEKYNYFTERAFVESSSIEILLHALTSFYKDIISKDKTYSSARSVCFREPDVSNEQEKYESNVTAVSKNNLVDTVSHREQQQQ